MKNSQSTVRKTFQKPSLPTATQATKHQLNLPAQLLQKDPPLSQDWRKRTRKLYSLPVTKKRRLFHPHLPRIKIEDHHKDGKVDDNKLIQNVEDIITVPIEKI